MSEKDMENNRELTAFIMINNKFFFKKKTMFDIYKYECEIRKNIILNIYTGNDIRNDICMYDNEYLTLFLEYIRCKCKNKNEIMNIYNEIFIMCNIPEKIKKKFEKMAGKYKKKNRKRKLFLLRKFIMDKFNVDKNNLKIISDHELSSNTKLFDIHLYLLNLNYDMYMIEFIFFGQSLVSILY